MLAVFALGVGIVLGSQGTDEDDGVPRAAGKLRPSPGSAFDDRPRLDPDGCYIGLGETRIGECEYGDRGSETTVVLLADSHGEPYFDALNRLAKRRGWRLVALAKSFCSVATIKQFHPYRDAPFRDCARWREKMLTRIDEREDAALVILASSGYDTPVVGGRELRGARAKRVFAQGFAKTLDRVHSDGAAAALVADVPRSQFKIPECIKDHRHNLPACDFPAKRGSRALARRAVELADDATLVNNVGEICGPRRCHAVVGNVIVYRDRGHLTATFGGTLTGEFGRRLPPIG